MSNKHSLTKLLDNKAVYRYQNFYCDFETVVFNNQHYVTCYSIVGENIKMYNVLKLHKADDLIEKSDQLVSQFILDCFHIINLQNKNKLHYIFFFHNLNKFDSYFILKQLGQENNLSVKLIARNNQIYKIIVQEKNSALKFELRDTLLYLPFSLDRVSQIFCIKNSKTIFNHEKSTVNDYIDNKEFQNDILKYCINDSCVLQEGFESFLKYIRNNLNIEPLKSLSLPSLSFSYFRTKFYNDSEFPIERLSKNKDSFIRKSYRGGTVDLYKPHLVDGFHYDVNSLYPYVMKNFSMPIGIGQWVNNITNIDEFFGFIKVEVTSPYYMHKPFLTYYDSELGLISPLGTWTEVYFSEEIKHALTLGYKFKYLEGISYKQGILFKEFVDHLYNLRLKFDRGTPLNFLLKLIMNSLYGKFGMKLNSIESKFIDVKELIDYVSIYDVKNISVLNKKALITIEKEPVLEKLDTLLVNKIISFSKYSEYKNAKVNLNNNSAVQIASAITAYGRIEMDKLKRHPNLDVYYSDTDSIFCKNPLPYEYVSDTELGKLKLENIIKEGLFLCPKVYMIKTDKNETVIKCKGLNNQLITDKDLYANYYDSTNLIKKVVFNFIRDFKKLIVLRKERNVQLSTSLKKRTKVIINGKWVDTNPLRI